MVDTINLVCISSFLTRLGSQVTGVYKELSTFVETTMFFAQASASISWFSALLWPMLSSSVSWESTLGQRGGHRLSSAVLGFISFFNSSREYDPEKQVKT